MQKVAVLGAGTMGHGIAQVCAGAGLETSLYDADPAQRDRGLAAIAAQLEGAVAKGKLTAEAREAALARLSPAESLADAVADADLVVEAVPERLDLKHRVFREVEAAAPARAILATNTSSLSIAGIAAAVADPGRVIGAHFFNPVPVMALLELVVAEVTRPDVVEAMRAFGVRIGKEVITVRDVPGFATSRLGVALGMEAIRMVEQGVASAEDIDKAMVLGYRHPIGPLKLTDLVGLDVRMNIGEYLAGALGNAAFEPPELMRRMVAEGRLGKKSGRGFYDW
jgi:3-hydroxybutyryl-CoA dehydrogenase